MVMNISNKCWQDVKVRSPQVRSPIRVQTIIRTLRNYKIYVRSSQLVQIGSATSIQIQYNLVQIIADA